MIQYRAHQNLQQPTLFWIRAEIVECLVNDATILPAKRNSAHPIWTKAWMEKDGHKPDECANEESAKSVIERWYSDRRWNPFTEGVRQDCKHCRGCGTCILGEARCDGLYKGSSSSCFPPEDPGVDEMNMASRLSPSRSMRRASRKNICGLLWDCCHTGIATADAAAPCAISSELDVMLCEHVPLGVVQ